MIIIIIKMILTKEYLEKLYYSNLNKTVCKELGITNSTLISYVKKFGIEQKGLGYGARKFKGKTKINLDIK
tara:strand:+ start:218 stop:430 length:213 start_codon:yes stop_codon:yes gene_type:complete